MNIPDEAVEAAIEALLGSKLGDHAGINGEEFVEAAHLALEAAAPHLMAAAWDEGFECGDDINITGHEVNPYSGKPALSDEGDNA